MKKVGVAQSQDQFGMDSVHSVAQREHGVGGQKREAMAEISICEMREESVFVDVSTSEHHRETWLGGVQVCNVSPECRRDGGKVAIVAAVGSLMKRVAGADLQGLIRLAGLQPYAGSGRSPILP